MMDGRGGSEVKYKDDDQADRYWLAVDWIDEIRRGQFWLRPRTKRMMGYRKNLGDQRLKVNVNCVDCK